jgi:hypothetical protein
LVGVAFDGAQLKLSTTTNNAELDASWTPEWGHIKLLMHFNETISGTASGGADFSDSSGGTITGIAGGTVTFGTTGKLKNSVSVDGTSGNIVLQNFSSLPSGLHARTMCSWANPSSLPNNYGFVGAYGTNSNSQAMYIGHSGSDLIVGGYGNDLPTVSGFWQIGKWHYVCLTYDGTDANLYADGILLEGPIAKSWNLVNNVAYIGQQVDTQQYWAGAIDEFSIWDTDLSLSEIQTIYARQSAAYSGTLTSRVMDSLSSGASWTNFSWVPTLPFFKELSATNEAIANYSALVNASGVSGDSALATGLVGLWHLDEASGAGSVVDSSGYGDSGTVNGGVTLSSIGKLNGSALFDGSTGFIDLGHPANLNDVTTTDFTFSAWVKVNALPPTNSGVNTSTCEGMILSRIGATEGIYVSYTGAFGFNYFNDSYAVSYVVSPVYPIGAWHLVTMTADTVNKFLHLYVDGTEVPGSPTTYSGMPLDFSPYNSSYHIGAGIPSAPLTNGNYAEFFNGSVDEAAIWSRALSANEILELYRRGANRIKYQVQTCQHAADCTNSPNWQGPDGTNQTYFSELDNTTAYDKVNNVPSGSVNAGLPNMTFSNFAGTPPAANRYFQYRTILESDDTSTNCNYDGTGVPNTWCSPELKSTSVGPGHYGNSVNTVSNSTGQGYVTLSSFAETLGTGGCTTGVVYNLSKDNSTWYYWNGSAWTLANGSVAQANAASSINSNIATFPVQVGTGTLYFKAFLQSSGTSTCSLSGVSVGGTK